MRNKFLSVTLVMVLLLAVFIAAPASQVTAANPQISVGTAAGSHGDTLEIPVVLSGNTGFSSLGIEIGYDASILELTAVTGNTNVGATFTKAQTLSAMPYNLGWNSAENNTFNGTLATLSFSVLSSAAGEYPISVSYYKGRNGNYTDGYDVNYDENFEALGLSYQGGKITVQGTSSGNPETPNGPKVSVGTAIGAYGDTLEIPVFLSGNTGFSSLGIEISYDKTALELTDVTGGNVGATFTKAQDLSAMPYNLGWSSAENNTFNGTLATLSFSVLSSVAGEYPISVSFYKGRDGNYTDGYDVNYDENFAPLQLSYVSGKIEISAPVADNSVRVSINGKSVVLSVSGVRTGVILSAIYTEKGELIYLVYYNAESGNVSLYKDVRPGSYAKIMWWKTIGSIQSVCNAERIDL